MVLRASVHLPFIAKLLRYYICHNSWYYFSTKRRVTIYGLWLCIWLTGILFIAQLWSQTMIKRKFNMFFSLNKLLNFIHYTIVWCPMFYFTCVFCACSFFPLFTSIYFFVNVEIRSHEKAHEKYGSGKKNVERTLFGEKPLLFGFDYSMQFMLWRFVNGCHAICRWVVFFLLFANHINLTNAINRMVISHLHTCSIKIANVRMKFQKNIVFNLLKSHYYEIFSSFFDDTEHMNRDFCRDLICSHQ